MALSLVSVESDVSFYRTQAQRLGGGIDILVLGCGEGRLALELAALGHQVVGVDPSQPMVQVATEKKSSETTFIHADLRALRIERQFSLVLAPHNGLSLMGSLDELVALFNTVRHHLRPDGAFAFDAQNPGSAMAFLPPTEEEPEGASGRPVFIPHLRNRTSKGTSGSIHRLNTRQYAPREVDSSLKAAGLVALERFGDFSEKAFEPTDEKQVVVAARVELLAQGKGV